MTKKHEILLVIYSIGLFIAVSISYKLIKHTVNWLDVFDRCYWFALGVLFYAWRRNREVKIQETKETQRHLAD